MSKRAFSRITTAVTLSVILKLGACTSSSPTISQSVSEVDATPSEQPQLFCRYEKETGSHQKRKICRTQAQLDKERKQAEETLRRVQEGGSSSSVGG